MNFFPGESIIEANTIIFSGSPSYYENGIGISGYTFSNSP
jgi:hypothetical protein